MARTLPRHAGGAAPPTITNPWVAPRAAQTADPRPGATVVALLVSAVAVGLVVDVGLRGRHRPRFGAGAHGGGGPGDPGPGSPCRALGLRRSSRRRRRQAGLAYDGSWSWTGGGDRLRGLAASTNADRPILGKSLVRLVWRGAGPQRWSGSAPGVGGVVDVMRRRPQATSRRPGGVQPRGRAVSSSCARSSWSSAPAGVRRRRVASFFDLLHRPWGRCFLFW
jgi:hypothetical protein